MTKQSYLRAREIAQLTGVSIRTARRWIAKRILVSGKVGGARLVAKSELERLLSPITDLVEEEEETEGDSNDKMHNVNQLASIREILHIKHV